MKRYLQDFLSTVTTLGTEETKTKEKVVLIAMLNLFENGRCGCEVLTDISNEIMKRACEGEDDESE